MTCARCDGDAGDTSEVLFAGELGEEEVVVVLHAASHACTVGVPNSTFLSSCFCIACTQTDADAAAAAAADTDTTYKTISHMFSGGHFTAPSDMKYTHSGCTLADSNSCAFGLSVCTHLCW